MEPLLPQDVLEEEVREDPLAHEPPLEVREHAQDGVDLAGAGELLELLRVDHALLRHRSSSLDGWRGGRAAAAPV